MQAFRRFGRSHPLALSDRCSRGVLHPSWSRWCEKPPRKLTSIDEALGSFDILQGQRYRDDHGSGTRRPVSGLDRPRVAISSTGT